MPEAPQFVSHNAYLTSHICSEHPTPSPMRHILFIGAHPDDCDFSCGGTAALMARRGDAVRFVSISNGDRGHFATEYVANRALLAERRREEGRRAAAGIGAAFE